MPGLGATGGSKWQISYGWHESKATDSYYRFHVNHTFDHNWEPRLRQSIMDVSVSYSLSSRTTLQATLPIVNNQFSSLLPPLGSSRSERYSWGANGLGDMTLYAQHWMLKPADHPFGNFAFGVGMKIPTGQWNLQRVIPNENGEGANTRAAWPPSMQPGDGGTGIIFGASAFKNIRQSGFLRGNTLFASASYLCNPHDTNGTASVVQALGVPLAPQFSSALVNSVTDSYMVTTGISIKLPHTWDKPHLKGLRGRIAYEWQGIPRYDLIGGSHGFRQPGYTMTIAPGFTYAYGHGMLIAEVPLTFNQYIDPSATAIPGLPIQTANGLAAAPFSAKRNIGMIAPVGISLRYVRTF